MEENKNYIVKPDKQTILDKGYSLLASLFIALVFFVMASDLRYDSKEGLRYQTKDVSLGQLIVVASGIFGLMGTSTEKVAEKLGQFLVKK